MSQRNSGYKRVKHDAYQTPEWVTKELLPFIPLRVKNIWECFAGKGIMVKVLRKAGFKVSATDINDKIPHDFFKFSHSSHDSIISNPPYKVATEAIEHALELTRKSKGVVIMLLSSDFNCASTRRHLFGDCPAYVGKVVLTRRIKWFGKEDGNNPSMNHAWYIWDHRKSAKKKPIEYYSYCK